MILCPLSMPVLLLLFCYKLIVCSMEWGPQEPAQALEMYLCWPGFPLPWLYEAWRDSKTTATPSGEKAGFLRNSPELISQDLTIPPKPCLQL